MRSKNYYLLMNKAIVLLSGGQDSATCLAIAQQSHDHLHCLAFDYGQRHKIEIKSAKKLANLANASFQLIDLGFLAALSNSSLVDFDQEITQSSTGLPSTFVPGRNALFLTVAAMVAHEQGAEDIFTGVCQTDFSGYPDCRETFIHLQEKTLAEAMDYQIKIHTPLMHLNKAETVLKMKSLGKLYWYKHTHTCYEGLRPACGKCPACKLRLNGFKKAGVIDPLEYC